MPVQVKINGVLNWIQPSNSWKTLQTDQKISSFDVKQDFLITSRQIE